MNAKSQTINKINNERKLDKILNMVEQMAKDTKLLMECKKENNKLREEIDNVRKENEQIKTENESMRKEIQKFCRTILKSK